MRISGGWIYWNQLKLNARKNPGPARWLLSISSTSFTFMTTHGPRTFLPIYIKYMSSFFRVFVSIRRHGAASASRHFHSPVSRKGTFPNILTLEFWVLFRSLGSWAWRLSPWKIHCSISQQIGFRRRNIGQGERCVRKQGRVVGSITIKFHLSKDFLP